MRGRRWPNEDAEVAALAAAGDGDAFEELVRRHGPMAYRVALRIMRDPVAADEAAQEALVRAWRSLEQFRGDARFTTWLYRIVVTTCLGRLRASGRDAHDELPELADEGAGPADEVIAGDTRRAVEGAMGRLAPGDRAAFVLRVFEGLEYAEIADALGVTVAAVRSRLRRARASVASELEEWT